MEIFLKNRLSFNYEITFLSCSAAPFINTCVLASTGLLGKPLKPLVVSWGPRGAGDGEDSVDTLVAVAFGLCLVSWRAEGSSGVSLDR